MGRTDSLRATVIRTVCDLLILSLLLLFPWWSFLE